MTIELLCQMTYDAKPLIMPNEESLDIGWNQYSNQKQRLYIGWKSGFPPTKNKLIFRSSNQKQFRFRILVGTIFK